MSVVWGDCECVVVVVDVCEEVGCGRWEGWGGMF